MQAAGSVWAWGWVVWGWLREEWAVRLAAGKEKAFCALTSRGQQDPLVLGASDYFCLLAFPWGGAQWGATSWGLWGWDNPAADLQPHLG